MRKLLASLIIGTLTLVSVNSQAATTNLLQTISVNFTIYSQGPTISGHGITNTTVNKASFKSSDLIKAIAKDAGISVSSKAELAILSEVVAVSTNQTYTTNHSGKITTNTVVTLGRTSKSAISIVDGSTITNVGNYATIVTTQTTLDSSTTGPQGVVTADTKYNIYKLTATTTTISFAATGFGTTTLEPVKEFGTSFNLNEADLTLAGNGIQGAASTLVLASGTVTSSFGGVIVK